MGWASNIVRDHRGRLRVEISTETGAALVEPRELSHRIRIPSFYTCLTVELSEMLTLPADRYLEALGLTHLSGAAQQVFMAKHHALEVLIPAQLLMVACFGTNQLLRQYMFDPGSQVALQEIADSTRYSAGIRQRAHWITSYKSARSAWSSIYRHALEGKLGLTLPRAQAELSLGGRRSGSALIVTHARVLAVTPSEEQDDGEQEQRLVFDGKAAGQR